MCIFFLCCWGCCLLILSVKRVHSSEEIIFQFFSGLVPIHYSVKCERLRHRCLLPSPLRSLQCLVKFDHYWNSTDIKLGFFCFLYPQCKELLPIQTATNLREKSWPERFPFPFRGSNLVETSLRKIWSENKLLGKLGTKATYWDQNLIPTALDPVQLTMAHNKLSNQVCIPQVIPDLLSLGG